MPRLIDLPWDSQPQGQPLDQSALAQFGICGGIIRGINPVTGQAVEPPAGGAINTSPAPSGLVSDFDITVGGVRNFSFATGNPLARSFTLMTRLCVNVTSYNFLRESGDGPTILLWRNGGQFDMRLNGTDYNQAGTWNLNQWYDIDIVGSASSGELWVNGTRLISGGAPGASGIGATHGASVSTGTVTQFQAEYLIYANRPLAPQERAEVHRWGLYGAQQIYIPTFAAPAFPTITLPRAKAGSATPGGFVPQWTAS